MRIIFDSHVHIYPCYDVTAFFQALLDALSDIDPSAKKMAFLTDVQGGTAFKSLCSDGVAGMKTERVDENCLVVRDEHGREVHLFNGRQIVTAERLEVLALVTSLDIEGRQPAEEVIKQINGSGGVPVIAWAVGKWFGSRGDKVRKLIDDVSLRPLLLGDSTMRPVFWGMPGLMEYGMKNGLKVTCGTDPLPFAGEELVAGTYASSVECQFSPMDPSGSARKMLLSADSGFETAGRRSSAWKWLARMTR